jgi:hypothetical protein
MINYIFSPQLQLSDGKLPVSAAINKALDSIWLHTVCNCDHSSLMDRGPY